jgi:hypothetical protein
MPAMHAANRRACPIVAFCWNNNGIINEHATGVRRHTMSSRGRLRQFWVDPGTGFTAIMAGRDDLAARPGFGAASSAIR